MGAVTFTWEAARSPASVAAGRSAAVSLTMGTSASPSPGATSTERLARASSVPSSVRATATSVAPSDLPVATPRSSTERGLAA